MRLLWSVILLAVAVGCVRTEAPLATESVKIVWKTPRLRYADMAFKRRYERSVEIELYATANALATMRIYPDKVCTASVACIDAASFNARYLVADYPEDILWRIMNAKALKDAKKVRKKRHGFTQHLQKIGKYDIRYRVLDNRIEFHDTINAITIIITEGNRI